MTEVKRVLACVLITAALLAPCLPGRLLGDELRPPRRKGRALRRTPVVEVFQTCKNSVVDFVSDRAEGENWKLYEFFRRPPSQRKKGRRVGVGSGFIIHPSGYILTNAHVFKQTIHRRAVLASGKSFPAEIIAVDAKRDLALAKIETTEPLSPVTMALPNDLMVGEQLILIGNPHGLLHTCTVGIVSGVGRNIRAGKIVHRGVIQADLGINPGNSGGPIFNILGEAAGMAVSMKQNSQSIAFAIPIRTIRRTLPSMLETERRYGLVTGVKLDVKTRGTIAEVAPDSAGQKAGLKAGDVLEQVHGRVIDSPADWSLALVGVQPQSAVVVEYTRAGGKQTTELIPSARKRPSGAAVLAKLLGVKAEPLPAERAKAIGLRSPHALVITEVNAARYPGQSAPQAGDLLASIGGRAPRSLQHVVVLFEKIKKGQPMPIVLLRVVDGKARRIDIHLRVR